MLSIDMALASLPGGLHGAAAGSGGEPKKKLQLQQGGAVSGGAHYDTCTDAWIKQNKRQLDGARGKTAMGVVGDHHHFITMLRPEPASRQQQMASGGPAPAFHAAPKLRGSPRSARGSFRHHPARGRSPVHSAREPRWGLKERPHKAPPIKGGKAAAKVPTVAMNPGAGHVTEPIVWQQLEALVMPQVQRHTERTAVSPPSMGAAVRFVVEDDLGQHEPAPAQTLPHGYIDAAMRPGSVEGAAPVYGHDEGKTTVIPVNLHRVGATTRRIGESSGGGHSAHAALPIPHVEDIHAAQEQEKAAAAQVKQGEWRSPRQPRPPVQRLSGPHRHAVAEWEVGGRRVSQPWQATIPTQLSASSPYNIDQYMRNMWDVDRAAAVAAAGEHMQPAGHEYQVPPRAPATPRGADRPPPLDQEELAVGGQPAPAVLSQLDQRITASVQREALSRQPVYHIQISDPAAATEAAAVRKAATRAPAARRENVAASLSATLSASVTSVISGPDGSGPMLQMRINSAQAGVFTPEKLAAAVQRRQAIEGSLKGKSWKKRTAQKPIGQHHDRVMMDESERAAATSHAAAHSSAGAARFVPFAWREVAQPCAQPEQRPSSSGAGGGRPTTPAGRKTRGRGGAFGRLEQQKAAQNVLPSSDFYRGAIASGGIVSTFAVDLRETPAPGPLAGDLSAAPEVAQRGAAPTRLNEIGDNLVMGGMPGSPGIQQQYVLTAESVAGDYYWRPTESLKWIPSLVPARGPVLSPHPAPTSQSRPGSPRALTRSELGVAAAISGAISGDAPKSPETGKYYASQMENLKSRMNTTDAMNWTHLGTPMNVSGPVAPVGRPADVTPMDSAASLGLYGGKAKTAAELRVTWAKEEASVLMDIEGLREEESVLQVQAINGEALASTAASALAKNREQRVRAELRLAGLRDEARGLARAEIDRAKAAPRNDLTSPVSATVSPTQADAVEEAAAVERSTSPPEEVAAAAVETLAALDEFPVESDAGGAPSGRTVRRAPDPVGGSRAASVASNLDG